MREHFISKTEVVEIDTRKALILLSIVVAVAVVGAIVLNEYSTAKAQTTVNGDVALATVLNGSLET